MAQAKNALIQASPHVSLAPPSRFDLSSPVLDLQTLFPPTLIGLLATLHKKFNVQRLELLQARTLRQSKYDQGELPQFGPKNSEAAQGNWKVAPIPQDLLVRRVEITGPVNEAKMVINMLNRTADGQRADTAMLDFEDSMKPDWENVLNGYSNVMAVSKEELIFVKPKDQDSSEKIYQLNSKDMAFPMVRVRGLHLREANFLVDGEEISGGLLDFVTCAFHTARVFLDRKKTPKYYIPKCEHPSEASWWNQLMTSVEESLGIPHASIRCTFLVETLPAAFLIEEILFEIKDRAVALNVGRWDKIFSDIKVLRNHRDRISPDRSSITMDRPWMENYATRLVKICHDRGALAIGGMSAFTPGKDATTRQAQTEKVRKDKEREYRLGHDGCWVSHPYFIGIAMDAFKTHNQINKKLSNVEKYPDLLMKNTGPCTISGLRTNLRVGIAYLQGWNKGLGCVAFDNLMEDLATLEISRTQTWQWLHHQIILDEGQKVTKDLIRQIFEEELQKIISETDKNSSGFKNLVEEYTRAKNEALALFTKPDLDDFLSFSSAKSYQ